MTGFAVLDWLLALAGAGAAAFGLARLVAARRRGAPVSVDDVLGVLQGGTLIVMFVPRAMGSLAGPPRIAWVVVWLLAGSGVVALAVRRRLDQGGIDRALVATSAARLLRCAVMIYVVVGWSIRPSVSALMVWSRMDMGDMTMTTNTPVPTLGIALALAAAAAAVLTLDRASGDRTALAGVPAKAAAAVPAAVRASEWVVLCLLLVVLLA